MTISPLTEVGTVSSWGPRKHFEESLLFVHLAPLVCGWGWDSTETDRRWDGKLRR